MNRPPDPGTARQLRLIASRMSRRGFLRAVGVGGAALAGGGLLSACGIGGAGSDEEQGTTSVAGEEVGGVLNFSNWPLYIDPGRRGTLNDFERKTGVKVNYFEDINSNEEYFAKIQGELSQGEDIGRDLMVLTDWMVDRLVNFGWLTPLDHEAIPNMDNVVDNLRSPSFDPDREFSLPWQSGITGIGYNPKLTGREIFAVEDLFAPGLAGQVTFLTEMRDTMSLVMASMGVDPANYEFSDYEAAIGKLQKAVDSGQARAFTGNDYAADLAAGNIGAAIAWSGDVIQSQFDNPDIKWVLPAEGGLLWSDNMCIPTNAANVANAHAFMNFVYEPEIAAQIAAWVNYITPVEGAREAMGKLAPSLVDNELIFPSKETLAQTFEFNVPPDEDQKYQEMFQAVIGA
jgi:spermidine/putrescine transport system substrate-binding protein